MQADDYFSIQNLLFSYPYALDRGDFDAVGRLFAHADVYSAEALMASRPRRLPPPFATGSSPMPTARRARGTSWPT